MLQVGDLVKHNKNGYVGLIVSARLSVAGSGTLYYIKWVDGAQGACWFDEVEVISASR